MKDCFDNESVTVSLYYTNKIGDSISRRETVQIFDGFPSPMDVVATTAENFLRDVGSIRTNTVFFVDELTEDEYEAVTGILMEMREQFNEDRDCQD